MESIEKRWLSASWRSTESGGLQINPPVNGKGPLRGRELKRVLIAGTSGSGKSTLAREVAKCLRLPFVASDDFWWEQGWLPAATDAVRARVLEAVGRDEWVLESNFDAFRDLVWPRADLIVWLDLPRRVVLFRVLRRNVVWAFRGTAVWSGNQMTFGRAWSGVRHAMQSYGTKRSNYPRWLEEFAREYVRLGSPREAARWLEELRDSRTFDAH